MNGYPFEFIIFTQIRVIHNFTENEWNFYLLRDEGIFEFESLISLHTQPMKYDSAWPYKIHTTVWKHFIILTQPFFKPTPCIKMTEIHKKVIAAFYYVNSFVL